MRYQFHRLAIVRGVKPIPMEHRCPVSAAMAVACLDRQDPTDRLANPANRESPGPRALLVPLASPRRRHAMCLLLHHANPAQLVRLVHPVLPDLLESPENPAPLVVLALTRHLDHLDLLDLLVPQALKANKACLEIKDHQPLLNLQSLANPEMLATSVQPALKVLLEITERMAHPALVAAKAPKALPVHLEKMVFLVLPVPLVLQGLPARRVFVQNTVPWMVVSSSKMERGAKQQSSAHTTDRPVIPNGILQIYCSFLLCISKNAHPF